MNGTKTDSPKLLIVTTSETFDKTILQKWNEEGFDVFHLSVSSFKDTSEIIHLEPLADWRRVVARFAIISKITSHQCNELQ